MSCASTRTEPGTPKHRYRPRRCVTARSPGWSSALRAKSSTSDATPAPGPTHRQRHPTTRPALHLPRLRPTRQLERRTPLLGLEPRRRNHNHQQLPALPLAPHLHPHQTVDRPPRPTPETRLPNTRRHHPPARTPTTATIATATRSALLTPQTNMSKPRVGALHPLQGGDGLIGAGHALDGRGGNRRIRPVAQTPPRSRRGSDRG